MNGLPVQEGAAALVGREHFIGQGSIDRRRAGLAALHVGNGDRIRRDAADEIGGAVDRIDYPHALGFVAGGAAFLAQEAVLRAGLQQNAADQILAGLVGVGYKVVLRLAVHMEIGVFQQHLTGSQRCLTGQIHPFQIGHVYSFFRKMDCLYPIHLVK